MSPSLPPFRTRPRFKEKVWAGSRLPAWVAGAPVGTGEAWLVSDVEGDASLIEDGPLAGATLREAVRERPRELLGERAAGAADAGEEGARFPLLVKLLDIAAPLSVQVHPDAAVVRELGDGLRGKCEAWLVLEAGPEGRVYLGLDGAPTPADVVRASREGLLAERLASFRPSPGEGLEIVPGTLHTARDVLVLEVQETSDVTYRVFDWGRERALHLEQTQVCLERIGIQPPPARAREPGWQAGVRALAPRSPFAFDAVELAPGGALELEGGETQALVLLAGRARLGGEGFAPLELARGQAVVIPAGVAASTVRSPDGARIGHARALPPR